jgi:hypothetical protein
MGEAVGDADAGQGEGTSQEDAEWPANDLGDFRLGRSSAITSLYMGMTQLTMAHNGENGEQLFEVE